MSPSAWFANVCLSLAGLVHSFGFETWLVVEHEKVCVLVTVFVEHKVLIFVTECSCIFVAKSAE